MRLHLTLLVLLLTLFGVKVQCIQATELCPRKEPPLGVLALAVGSEVILDCSGEVTVDGVSLAVGKQHNGRLRRREATSGIWRSQRERDSVGTTGTFHSTVKNFDGTGTYQNETATGIVKTKEAAVTFAETPAITTKEQTRQDFTVSQSSDRAGNAEGGTFGVTMENGRSMEYEDYEDYEENEDGLRVTRAIKRQTRWTWNGKRVRSIKRGWALRLPALQLNDSGNYSCYRGDQLISTVKILVGVPPETPTISCHKKFHTSKVRCEWISRKPIIPRPQCYILVKKGFENFSREPCSYSAERSRCWCALYSEEGDKRIYDTKLCVTNTAGSAISRSFRFSLPDIIKPDPPAKVVVKPVKGQTHTLTISWSYPSTWKFGYYFLHFQLRYRPLLTKEYQHVLIEGYHRDLTCWISDALPQIQYEVQLQAKDEYDGVWSEWSSPVYAYTWTAPVPTIASDEQTTLEPLWTFPEGSGYEDNPKVEITGHPTDNADVWIYVLSAFGLCLFVVMAMLSVCSLRHRVWFISKMNKKSCNRPCSYSPPSPPSLHQSLMEPRQKSQHHFLPVKEEEQGGINLHNFDYFLSSSGD